MCDCEVLKVIFFDGILKISEWLFKLGNFIMNGCIYKVLLLDELLRSLLLVKSFEVKLGGNDLIIICEIFCCYCKYCYVKLYKKYEVFMDRFRRIVIVLCCFGFF